ncbi:uncharacterized protein LOC128244325 [Mya arenaria]|uniref:uncharacterized protein LOC128244325 n=1 Tax=Mya arenaria TaxID=6604 RepID=UPI0022E272D3|nr:uncharacterized protein LOC128244325 [Mya arenaria]
MDRQRERDEEKDRGTEKGSDGQMDRDMEKREGWKGEKDGEKAVRLEKGGEVENEGGGEKEKDAEIERDRKGEGWGKGEGCDGEGKRKGEGWGKREGSRKGERFENGWAKGEFDGERGIYREKGIMRKARGIGKERKMDRDIEKSLFPLMDVPGKKRDPYLDKGSADSTVYCQPCGEGGKRSVAQGICQTCEEYMCAPCVEYHKRLKMSRNHILLSKDKMPSFYPSTKKSAIADTDYCNNHPKEMIKFYCPTHGDLGCGDCVVLDHRSCKVDFIADVAKEFVTAKEFRELEPSIKRTEDLLSEFISNVKEIFGDVKDQSKVQIDKLRKFRAEINTYMDRREKELLDNIERVKGEDDNMLTALKTDCELMKDGLEAMRTELTSDDVPVNQRYVTARRGQKELRGINEGIKMIAGRMKARKFQFTKDPDKEQLLGSKIGIGTLDVAGEIQKNIPAPDLSTATWKNEADINVRVSQDQATCFITGLALVSPGFFILTDFHNNCAKLVDVTSRTVTSRIELNVRPWDVCVLDADQAAVTLPYISIIQLLSTKGGQLSRGKKIKVANECRGIAYYNNRLYVSYVSNPRIEVMTLDGNIISTIQTDDGRQPFKKPLNLTVTTSTPLTLYVSDCNAHTVLQLSLEGKVLRENRNKKLEYPMSVVQVGPGQLLVCGRDSLNVMLLTEKDGKMAEILEQKEGLIHPFSVSFCPHERAIVVGILNSDSLKVFKAI